MVQWWELPLGLAVLLGIGGLIFGLLHLRFKQLEKIYGGKK